MNEAPWYERFFDETYLRSYRDVLSHLDPVQETDFIVERLSLRPGMRVLDLCCGQGRHSVELAKRGLKVVGQDLSKTLLEHARRRADEAHVDVELVRRDMREIEWSNEFDAVVNLFTAFGYFEEDEENFRVLEGVAKALKPEGGVCIDVISYPWLMRNWEARGWRSSDDGLLAVEERRMDWMRGVQIVEHTYVEPDGSRRSLTHHLRLFPSHELVQWLRRAGVEPEALYGSYTGEPYTQASPRLVVVARKRG